MKLGEAWTSPSRSLRVEKECPVTRFARLAGLDFDSGHEFDFTVEAWPGESNFPHGPSVFTPVNPHEEVVELLESNFAFHFLRIFTERERGYRVVNRGIIPFDFDLEWFGVTGACAATVCEERIHIAILGMKCEVIRTGTVQPRANVIRAIRVIGVVLVIRGDGSLFMGVFSQTNS